MKHPIQNLLEACEYKCQTYSGRGMFGRYCLGVVVGSLPELIGDVLEASARAPARHDDRSRNVVLSY